MTSNLRPLLRHALFFAITAALFAPAPAGAEVSSRLNEITKSKKLRVCQFPLYYSISFRNPKTGVIEGIDADLAKELAKELGAQLEIVESSFGTFIADLQAKSATSACLRSAPRSSARRRLNSQSPI
jgi:cyclohexadienyl dehydratase